MKHTLFALLLCGGSLLSAQTDTLHRYHTSPVYVQGGLGLLPILDAFAAEISVAGGYRVTPAFGVGLEFRSTGASGASFGHSASLLGVQVRGHARRGWYGLLGGGAVLSASQGSDGFISYDYLSGGSYLATDLGYQVRWGLTLGVYMTVVSNTRHDVIYYNLDTDEYERPGEVDEHGFFSLGFKVGYAFPGRPRRR